MSMTEKRPLILIAPSDHSFDTAYEHRPKFELYQDKAGEYRFRLTARNGEIIAVSEGYKAKASCENGIASVRKNAEGAAIEE